MIRNLVLALPLAGFSACGHANETRAVVEPNCTSRIEIALAELVSAHDLPGAVLVTGTRDQRTQIYAHGGMENETVIPVASASKIVVSAVIGRLVETGSLSFETTVADIWPDLDTPYAAVTLEELLTHRSGIPPNAVFGVLGAGTVTGSAERLLSLEPDFEPGTAFAYGGSSFQVAAAMAERATGMDWNTIFETQLAEPLRLSNSFFAHPMHRTPQGSVQIGGGLWSNAEDLSRLLEALTDREDGFLDQYIAEDMGHGRLNEEPLISVPEMVPEGFNYALGVWCMEPEAGGCNILHSAGAFGTIPMLNAENGRWALIVTRGRLADIFDAEIALLGEGMQCTSEGEPDGQDG